MFLIATRRTPTSLRRDLPHEMTPPSPLSERRALFLRTPRANLLWDCLSLLDGAVVDALKSLGGISVDRKPGDFIKLPAYTRHRVERTTLEEPTTWLAVHYGDQQ